MNLKQLIKQKKELEETVSREVSVDTPNAHGIMGLIKRARIDLEQNKEDYIKQAKTQECFILTFGSQSQEFAEKAVSGFGCYVVDSEEFYKSLADKVDDAYIGQGMSQHILNIAQAEIDRISSDIGIMSTAGLIFNMDDAGIINDRTQLKDIFKRIVNNQIGVELNSLYVAKRAADLAYEDNFDGNTLPVIIVGEDVELMTSMIENSSRAAKKCVTVSVGDSTVKTHISQKELNEETLEKVFAQIKKSIK